MKFLAWSVMASVFVTVFVLTQDVLLSFAAQLFAVFLMVFFARDFFFGKPRDKEKE